MNALLIICGQCSHETTSCASIIKTLLYFVEVFYGPYSVTTGRERSSWCEWNSGLPGMSRTERCQGKHFNININIQFKHICFCKLSVLLFIKYNNATLFSFSVQGGRGYSGEKVSVFLGFNKVLIINSNIQTVKKK